MDNENVVNADTLNSEEVAAPEAEVTEAEVSDETVVDVAKLQELNKKLYARAKQAEAKLKVAPKVNPPKKDISNQTESQFLTREEAILIAKGEDESSLAQLKAISKGKGISLLEAQKDDMFQVWKDKQESESKSKKAKLGASKGSGSQKPEKSVAEMSRAEHEAHVRKLMNG